MTDPAANEARDASRGGSVTGVFRLEHDAMACTFGLDIAGADQGYAAQAARAAFDEIDRLEQILSRFIAHSEIAQINALTPGRSIRVGPETIECLQLASQVYAETNGAFDISFRSQRRAGGADRMSGPPPLVFDPVSHAVGVQVSGVVLDLGALGKGYAVDRAVAILREWGITAALVHSGQSSVRALGHAPDAPAWRLALRDPDDDAATLATVSLCDRALSGSGQRRHDRHIIDPRTGRPADAVRGAWAVAPTAALSDALSTAFMIMTADEIEHLCRQRGDVSAILRPQTPSGQGLVCLGARVELAEPDGGNLPEVRTEAGEKP